MDSSDDSDASTVKLNFGEHSDLDSDSDSTILETDFHRLAQEFEDRFNADIQPSISQDDSIVTNEVATVTSSKSHDGADPELECILKKYSDSSANTENDELEVIELTSDEDDTESVTVNPKDCNGGKGAGMPSSKKYEFSSDEDDVCMEVYIKAAKTSTEMINKQNAPNNCFESKFVDENPQFHISSKELTDSTEQIMEDLQNKYMFETSNENFSTVKCTSSTDLQKRATENVETSKSNDSPLKKKVKLSPDQENNQEGKKTEQAKKREEKEREQALNKAIKTAHKNMKPKQCMKFITVLLDNEILTQKYAGEILNALQAADVLYRLQSHVIPCTVMWTREVQKHIFDENDQLATESEVNETSEVLLIMNCKDVIEKVNNNLLITYIKSIQSVHVGKRISLAIYGMDDYFKHHRILKQKSRADKSFTDVSRIDRQRLQFSLTKLQLLCGCCYRLTETPQDVGSMIAQFTKAIAEAPYKLEKYQELQEADWYISGDNKDCVQVDKSGNGLHRLWQQQLTTFPLARLELAEAIVTKYPTPSSLMKDYNRCAPGEGEKLLQDIPVRRAAGPLTSVRKIGPEFSKKVFTFFTSTNGKDFLQEL